MEDRNRKNEIIQVMMNVEYLPATYKENINLKEYTKMPLAELTTLGAGLSSIAAPFNTITQSIGFGGGDTLYRAVMENGISGELPFLFKDGSGFVSSYRNSIGKLAQAHFEKVSGVSTISTIPYNPTMLFMSVAMFAIEKKLNDIQKTQQEILEFMEEDKRAKLKGDLNFLADILNNYKYNWDNKTYKTNMHIKVQDIKQDAGHNIVFYRDQIEKGLNRRGVFIGAQDIKGKMRKIQSGFRDYQTALYLYGFSSFLEVMLLENFDSGYLDSIANKIQQFSYQYRESYTTCYNQLKGDSKSSIESHLLEGLANASGVAGDKVAKIPLISRSQLDKNLIETSRRLGNYKSGRTEQTMERFVSSHDSCVRPFIENIDMVNRLYNQPMDLLFDKENLYLKSPAI